MLVGLIQFSIILKADIFPEQLTCEYLHNPMAVDILSPRLCWINVSPDKKKGEFQTAWEIRVSGTKEKLLHGEADLWSSGKVLSNESLNIQYAGKPLSSRQDCWWQVRVWDSDGKISGWSEPAFWSMGLLDHEDWEAEWIGAPWQGEETLPKHSFPLRKEPSGVPGNLSADMLPPPAPMLRKSFILNKDIASARAFVTGLGFFEFYINGKKVSDDVLVPNVTLYGKRDDLGPIGIMIKNNFREYRVMYLAYDIKEMLKTGENVAGAMLGNGFYNPANVLTQGYGAPRFLGQIHITYTDGTEQVIVSDKSWKASKGPVVLDLIYDGEQYDARLEKPGWNTAGFDDSEWEMAALRKAPDGVMTAHMALTDRVMERLDPLKISKLGEGHYRVDFGQEISGWLRLLNVKGESGHEIGIKYICESPVGNNSYTMKGGGPESYAARFTWFVFREVEIINWPGELSPSQLIAEAVYTNIETTAKFECSNPLFNAINRIWWRSQTDNMHGGIASDCPHRERLPYTGDGQVACVTVMHNFDARSFYTKWIRDILGAQNPETGYVPNGAPWQPTCGGGIAWGAAMVIMPWEFYLHYNDTSILRNNFEGMKGYLKYLLTWTDEDGILFSQAPERNNPNQWINLGDWVAPGKLPPDDMVHTFYLWRCADLTSKAAKVLGISEDESYYMILAEKTRKAFQKKYYDNEKGTYGPFGGNIYALKMGIPIEQKNRVIAALISDINANGDHLDTGIFGTQFFFEVLSENGLHELAFRVMNQRTQPGYGWWIEQGATTTWEEWNGQGSHNHPMFGGGITWFYRKIAGMNTDPDNPGYRHIIFKPQPAYDLKFASYYNQTPYGKAGISWKKESAKFFTDINIPVGCSATVYIPASNAEDIMENGEQLKSSENIVFQRLGEGYAVFKISSGNYNFESVLSF